MELDFGKDTDLLRLVEAGLLDNRPEVRGFVAARVKESYGDVIVPAKYTYAGKLGVQDTLEPEAGERLPGVFPVFCEETKICRLLTTAGGRNWYLPTEWFSTLDKEAVAVWETGVASGTNIGDALSALPAPVITVPRWALLVAASRLRREALRLLNDFPVCTFSAAETVVDRVREIRAATAALKKFAGVCSDKAEQRWTLFVEIMSGYEENAARSEEDADY
jgi:hypothetical protein